MLKLLATSLLLSSIVHANENKEIEKFLKAKFSENPAIVSLTVKVVETRKLPKVSGWYAVIVDVDAIVKAKPSNRAIEQKMIWFTDGNVITKELTSIKSGESLKDSVNPMLKPEHYKKANLIYGNPNAKHKVAIFSDPLCPFCGTFVPQAIEEMRKQPNKYAIYYYHFPLPAIHPAAVELSKAAIAAELDGMKNVALRLYTVQVDPNERNVRKILDIFNRKMGTDLKEADLNSKQVIAHFKSDLKIAEDVMVAGTPTLFFDGKLDRTKRLYQKVK